ncbi:RICIN domain-containing protein [Streptomyces sp. NPDC090106]|uniref:RICIN domain-containing protein n=1 Tax=Streptomyces sp. NPDC090106 TaxID=3365946 RepID=UPI00381FBA5A
MQSPHPPRPPYPPYLGAVPEESDRGLVAQLGGAQGGARAVSLLLARHWRAAHEYAVICLASSASSADLVTAAAFQRLFGRVTGGAVRPQLLVAVRDTVKEWAADDRIAAALPELRKPAGGRGLRAARAVTPERRRIAERAFQALPGASQCLLWHVEVEAEPISVPAGLSAVDVGRAADALEQAREQFRQGCVRAHRELAPTKECRFHNRLLDVPMRRGGALLPDVRQHLLVCRHCRHAAEQLSHFDGGLGELLAETVLGWGARRYLDSRPGRAGAARRTTSRRATGGRHRPVPRRPRPRAVAVVGLVSLALLATVLVARSWSDDDGVPVPRATWGAPSGQDTVPGPVPTEPGSSPSAASATEPVETGGGRLRGLVSGLCLDLRGGRVRDGVAATLATCSTAPSQQWTHQDDGLLRSLADPGLCLGSDPAGRSVSLVGCLVHAGEVQYDLTVSGRILLRWHKELAVVPDRAGHVVVAEKDASAAQRWLLESVASAGSAGSAGHGEAEPKGEAAAAEPRLSATPSRSPAAEAPGSGGSGGPVEPVEPVEPRVARVGHGGAGSAQVGAGEGAAEGPVPLKEVAVLPVARTVVTALESVLR